MSRYARLAALLLLCTMPIACSSADEENAVNTDDAGVPTVCGWPLPCWEALCRNNDCGGPESAFDEDGCYRPSCETNPCDAGQECREVEYKRVLCSGVLEDGTCHCGYQPLVLTNKMCFPMPP
jgi:hypothetical protein